MYAQHLEEALEFTFLGERMLNRHWPRPGDSGFRENLVNQYYRVAAVTVRMSRHEEAIQAAKSLTEVAPSDAGRFVTAARLMARCSTITEANPDSDTSLFDQSSSEGQKARNKVTERYENLAVNYLSRAVELGYSNVNSLTSNSQFESIHAHPGFLNLVAEAKQQVRTP